MIALATLLWAAEVVVARRLLVNVPPTVLGACRLGIGLVVLGGYVALSGRVDAILALAPGQWLWVLATGLLLAAYVGIWFAALQRAPATVVTAVLVIGAPITAALALFAGAAPTPAQIAGYTLVALAAFAIAAAIVLRRPRMVQGAAAA